MIFRFSAPYQYLLENIEFCFHLSSIFWLLTSKIATEKKPKHSKKKKYFVKFNDSWCNKFKFIQKAAKGKGFAWCTLCGSDFSVVHGGENDINRYTSKHTVYVDAAQQKGKLTDLGKAQRLQT